MADEKDLLLDMRELGATGLQRYGGFVYEEFLRDLVGQRAAQVYKEMGSNDAVCGAVLFAIQMLIRQVKWYVEPASDQPFDKEPADFLTSCMEDMNQPWNEVINEAMSMLQYGFAPLETVFKMRTGRTSEGSMNSKHSDGRIGWRKMAIRSQDTIYRWHFDEHGGIRGLDQLAPPLFKLTFIPIEKMLLFRTTTRKNNPEGYSILRNAYRSWYLKKNIENIEGIGVERDLAGLPVALVPPDIMSANSSPAQKQILANVKKIVTNIRRDEQEGVVFPMAYDANGKPLYELKLLSTGGSRQFDTDKIVQRYDHRIALCALADMILLGQNSVGSFALSSSKTELFADAIGAFLDMAADVINRYAVPRLFDLNQDFFISDYPKICHSDLENVDLKELGDYITKLAGAGAPLFPNAELEKHLYTVAGLPEPMNFDITDEDMRVTEPRPKSEEKQPVVIPENPDEKTPMDSLSNDYLRDTQVGAEVMAQAEAKRTQSLYVVKGDWDESKHPRAEGGKFGEGGGSKENAGRGPDKRPSIGSANLKKIQATDDKGNKVEMGGGKVNISGVTEKNGQKFYVGTTDHKPGVPHLFHESQVESFQRKGETDFHKTQEQHSEHKIGEHVVSVTEHKSSLGRPSKFSAHIRQEGKNTGDTLRGNRGEQRKFSSPDRAVKAAKEKLNKG